MAVGKRRQLFVDAKVQGALVVRTVAYWGFCLIAVTLMLLLWRVLSVPGRTFAFHVDWLWFHYAPAAVASMLLLPIIVLDSLRMSNRFAGPMVRLRRAMNRLAEGESVQPINFRDDDFWSEFAEDFNRMLARQKCLLHEMSNEQAETLAPSEDQLEEAIENELALDETSELDLELEIDPRAELACTPAEQSGKR
jgi:methyl-accepting chemotaxis protein